MKAVLDYFRVESVDVPAKLNNESQVILFSLIFWSLENREWGEGFFFINSLHEVLTSFKDSLSLHHSWVVLD